MSYLSYAGVGSRQTPVDILCLMKSIATRLAATGYVLRSGGAAGADRAFQSGAGRSCEIFRAQDATTEAAEIARQFHPAWHRCGDFAKALHARNAFQVLGRDLISPVKFVICWTPDGAISHAGRSIRTGGTGTAISIASANSIPVFNLQRPEHLARLLDFVK